METKTTTINGKEVTLAYNFATEINFSKFTKGENASVFVQETAKKLDALTKGDSQSLPDIEKCIYLIIAAAIAYYKSKEEECPITADDLLFTEKPAELYEALGKVIILFGIFYDATGEPKKEEGEKGKN